MSTSYDLVPYSSYPYRQSHPDRLATLGTLFGMRPAPIERCRVLELGCASGGNLLPIGALYPQTECIGIDASEVQIQAGDVLRKQAKLSNVRLTCASILDIDETWGKFDYILCHGVYSWVGPAVQEKILRICRENLTPQGIAYISYNTYPGWHMRGMIRDMMCYRAQSFRTPEDRVKQARALLDFLAQAVPEDSPYGTMLRRETHLLQDKEDHYLFHDHLEEHNQPLYFHQFAEQAQRLGLQYLAEADYSSMSTQNFPASISAMIHSVASDLIQIEQYMDFVRNRMFRQTLLCHADTALERTNLANRIQGLSVASQARPEKEPVDISSNEQVIFRSPAATTTTTSPLLKSALLRLREAWPTTIPFAELLATAHSRIDGSTIFLDSSQAARNVGQLAEPLLRCYGTSQIELSTVICPFTTQLGDRLQTTPLIRVQANQGSLVTNLRHETVTLTDLERHVVQHLDGQHSRERLLQVLKGLVRSGTLVARQSGMPIESDQDLLALLDQALQSSLQRLANAAIYLSRPLEVNTSSN